MKVASTKTSIPLTGATVCLSTKAIAGKDPGSFDGIMGMHFSNKTTNNNGIASFIYSAPYVGTTERNRTITVEASAAKTDYEVSTGFSTFPVFSEEVKYLTANIDVAKSVLKSKVGKTEAFRINVIDETGNGVSGILVQVTVEHPIGLAFAQKTVTTDTNGVVLLTYTSTKPGNYTVWVNPVKTTVYQNVFGDTNRIDIQDSPVDGIEHPSPYPYIIIGIVIVAVVIIIFFVTRKKDIKL